MRKIIIIAVCCVVVATGGYAGYKWYVVRKQNHLISLAQQYMANSDGQKALLCLQLVLRSNPNNLAAIRMMANLSGAVQSPSALMWRKRVAELNPDSLEDQLSLVQTALILRDYNTATKALAAVSVEGRKTAAFQNVAGTVAEAANNMAEAEAYFEEALRLEPTNRAVQLNLAMVRLHGTNLSDQLAARTVLGRISADPASPALRCMALRELIMDAEKNQQLATALTLSKELVQQTNSLFTDKLLRLDLLKGTGSAEYKPMLADAQRSSISQAENIVAMASWQEANISVNSTLTWLRSLPLNIQTNQPTALVIAQCLSLKQDWPGVQRWAEKQNWAGLEFMRHAFLARALREQGLTATSETEWQQAVTLANNQESSLVLLLRKTAEWKWESKGEDLLWQIVDKYPGEQWANKALVQGLYNSGRTRSLMALSSQQLKFDPANLSVKNNLARCALLLDEPELKPNELARAVFEAAPDNPFFASTYAFSLFLQKKNAEALKIIEQLKPQDLERPSVAGYYGLILKAAGNPAKARIYLDLALKSNLLPEEQKLFDQAMTGM
jgi:tetratricopeptide (TPR) repeat protein